MFGRLWRYLKWGAIALVLLAIAAPLWDKVGESYDRFEKLVATIPYLNWASGWLALLIVAFVVGILADIFWQLLVFWRFRNTAEIKVFHDPADDSRFYLALIVGEWLEEYEENGEKKIRAFYACNQFLDLFLPKNLTEYLRKDLEGIAFVRTGRDPREHIWDVLKCRLGLVRIRIKNR